MHTDHGPALWTTPQCPFAIEYSPRVLDSIRLAVVDAFFSLPRGGAEIGGILLGSRGRNRVVITDYAALECEHAFGPGFTLSDKDQARLLEMLEKAGNSDLQPVGWYHSHTRSDIFLSEADLEIHRRYFPEPWQVALVIKPHTFQPARAGFFFRAADGSIHASGSYREFQLQPLAGRQAPSDVPLPRIAVNAPPPAPMPKPAPLPLETVMPAAPQVKSVEPERVEVIEPEPVVIEQVEVEPVAAEPAEAEPQAEPEPAQEVVAEAEAEPEAEFETAIPSFLRSEPRSSWRWFKPVAAIAIGGAIGSAAFAFRQAWLPPVLAGLERLKGVTASAAPKETRLTPAPAALGLSVLDNDGQLQVHWDRNSAVVHTGSHAVLEIVDSGSTPRVLLLDEAHLESGTFTYAREGERVDVALSVEGPDGKHVRESTTFLGKLPLKAEDATSLRRERDDLARQRAQVAADLKTALERNRKLERSLSDAQSQLNQQRRRRLENQVSK